MIPVRYRAALPKIVKMPVIYRRHAATRREPTNGTGVPELAKPLFYRPSYYYMISIKFALRFALLSSDTVRGCLNPKVQRSSLAYT